MADRSGPLTGPSPALVQATRFPDALGVACPTCHVGSGEACVPASKDRPHHARLLIAELDDRKVVAR